MENKYLWEYLKKTDKSIVIYGMGDGCDKILSVCKEKGIPVKGIFASDEYVRNKIVHGFPVTSFSEIQKRFGEVIVLLAFGVFRDDLMNRILQMAKDTELYAPEVPLFGGGLFDREYEKRHEKELSEVKALLSDEKSREVFRCLLEYKRTGSIFPLIECETKREDDLKTLVPFREGEVYVDLGAYDGDTVLEWASLHPRYGKIIGVEPCEKTFIKLKSNCTALRDFEAIKGAVWNRNEALSFNSKSGRSAAVDRLGSASVNGFRLSDRVKRADFIKFDVEGAEKEALEGAEELIRACKPTLCVSAYHRTEDLFSLPLQIKRICPEYRVYLRHFPYVPAWDTVFFFSAR